MSDAATARHMRILGTLLALAFLQALFLFADCALAQQEPQTSSTARDACEAARRQVHDSVAKRFEGILQKCETDLSTLKGESEELKRKPGNVPVLDEALSQAIQELARRLRPDRKDALRNLTAEIQSIDQDVASVLSEREGLKASVTALQGLLDELQRKEDGVRDGARKVADVSLDASLNRRPCAILTKTDLGDGTFRVAGWVPDSSDTTAIREELERAAPGLISDFDVTPIGARVCLQRVNPDWAIGRVGGRDGDGSYDIVLTPELRNLLPFLPDSADACAQVADGLSSAAPRLSAVLGSGNDTVEMWARLGNDLVLCRSTSPRDRRSWTLRGSVTTGKSALLLIGLRKNESRQAPRQR